VKKNKKSKKSIGRKDKEKQQTGKVKKAKTKKKIVKFKTIILKA
jgi:hypothetical protein